MSHSQARSPQRQLTPGPRAHSPAGRQRVTGASRQPPGLGSKVGENWELAARGQGLRTERKKELGILLLHLQALPPSQLDMP